MNINERKIAYALLLKFNKNRQRLDQLEQIYLKEEGLTSEQKRNIKNSTSGVIRNLTLLDFFIAELYKGAFAKMFDKTKIVLRLGLYEIEFMPHIPEHASVNEYVKIARKIGGAASAKLVNAILRNFIRRRQELFKHKVLTNPQTVKEISTCYSFPEWLIKRWVGYWGKEFTRELCAATNTLPEFDLRININKITLSAFCKILEKNGIEYSASNYFPNYITVKSTAAIRKLGLFEKGLCSVQDESAAIPVKRFKPRKKESFLDICAAPGGKFTQYLEEHSPEIAIAVDSDFNRLKRINENLHRLDLAGFVVQADATNLPFKKKFDNILVDAPCSGTGVIAKHPDIKWRRNEQELKEFTHLQEDILEKAAQFLNQKGTIVYSTCSVDNFENDRVVKKIIQKKGNKLKPENVIPDNIPPNWVKSSDHFLKTFPSVHRMDGSFSAVLKKS